MILRPNNVTRYLDKRSIQYQVYELPKMKLGAMETANYLNIQPKIVFKTIVISRPHGGKHILAVVPAPKTVDIKSLAKALKEKKLRLTTQAEAERITGLKTGGISPLALLNRGFQVIVDISASNYEQIHISGGEIGLNIKLPVIDLIKITHATIERISDNQ